MHSFKPYISSLCLFSLLAPGAGFAAGPQDPSPAQSEPAPHGLLSRITGPYRARQVPPPGKANSPRLESLLRAGNLYLSLQDAIALALENNLDIEVQRYGPSLADAALELAKAGGFARGVSTSVTAGPSSASVSSSGTTPGSNQNAASQASAGSASAVGSGVIQQSGPAIPSLDPMLVSSASWSHSTTPETSAFITGTNSLITRSTNSSVAIQKSFLTGTIVSLGLNSLNSSSNNPRNDFNPASTASLNLSFTQHLLQGFGPALNSRQIHIARNNREVADLTFKLQVETTVAAVMELYWDLVAFNENVRVARESVAAAQRLYNDNKRQVEVGTMAQIEVVRAEAQIASAEQSQVAAQMQVLQQETILKTALSRTGIANPEIAAAHIIPTDPIRIPDVEPVAPIQDLIALAIGSRPELAQSRIQLQNQALTIRGSKNSLLPALDAVVNMANNGLAGEINPLPAPPGTAHSNTAYFIGGYGTVLSQLFSRNFPNYSAGFSLNIPIRNRAAQAQVINDELTLRQQQVGLQRLENQVRVDVQNALIGLTQTRAQYQAAAKARVLQVQTLDAEQKKLELGASTVYNVIADQQALEAAQFSEVQAEAAYAKAKVEMDRATGQILEHNDISLDEAYHGIVSRPPSPLPPEAK
jgi:outer membrane protein TolC